MNTKIFLWAGIVLVLTVGCAWAAPEVPDTAGFTAVPDNEAAQIVGGTGRVCDLQNPVYEEYVLMCSNNGDPNHPGCATGKWYYQMARYRCADAESGECYEYFMVYQEHGDCGWYPEYEECVPISFDEPECDLFCE